MSRTTHALSLNNGRSVGRPPRLLALLLLLPAGCSSGSQSGPDPSEATFVGRQACGRCHEDEARQWTGSHHDLAMQVADEQTVLGDFADATFEYNGVTSRFFREDGGFKVRTDGPDGTLQTFRITHTFGVEPLQQYLVEQPGGRLQALSICWDTRPEAQGGQRWFHLYRDEAVDSADVLHWTGILQNWNQMCAECHSTDVRKNFDLATDSYSTSFAEIDVSCEACHGPGSKHAAWAEREPRSGDPGLVVRLAEPLNGWLVDSATGLATRDPPLAAHRQVEACGRCHARRGVLTGDYHYGEPLSATHRPALLTAGLYYPDGQIEDEVYVYGSFRQSRMYAAGVGCSDCHNPHSLQLNASDNGLCNACHQASTFDTVAHHHHEPGREGASCVACHMPARNYMVVDPRRDHSFRVPRPDLSVLLGVPDVCTGCHTDQTAAWAAAEVDAWRGGPAPFHYGSALAAGRTTSPAAVAGLLSLIADSAQPSIVRATALETLPRLSAGRVPDSLTRPLRDPDPLVRRAAVTAVSRVEVAERLRVLQPLLADPVLGVRIEAARALAGVGDDLPPEAREAFSRALQEYRAAQWVNADRPEAHLNLGLLAIDQGEFDEAERSYQEALGRSPSFVGAWVNLADLYRQQQRDGDAEATLRRGLEQLPDHPDLQHALGLTLIRLERREEGLAFLRRAAGGSPDNPRYAYVFAAALDSQNRGADSLAVLRRALDQHPEDPALLSSAVTTARRLGRLREALELARRLQALSPEDPRLQALVQQLEREAG